MTKGTYNYDNLLSYCCDNNITLLQDYKDINVTRDTLIVGKCNNLNCNNQFGKTFRQLKVSKDYCKDCTKSNKKIQAENTCLLKYGVKSVFQCKEIRDNMTKNIIKKYGVNNVSQSDKIKNKKAATCLKNHGVSVSFKSKEIKEKIKKSYLTKLGVDNPFKSDIIKQQIRVTNLEKYGAENPQQNKEIKNKQKVRV